MSALSNFLLFPSYSSPSTLSIKQGFSKLAAVPLAKIAAFLPAHDAVQLEIINRSVQREILSPIFFGSLLVNLKHESGSRPSSYLQLKAAYAAKAFFSLKNLEKPHVFAWENVTLCVPPPRLICQSKASDVDQGRLAYVGLFDDPANFSRGYSIVVRDIDKEVEIIISVGAHDITCLKLWGNQVFAGNTQGQLIVADITTGQSKFFREPNIGEYRLAPPYPIIALVVYGDILISGGTKGLICLWKMDDFSILKQFKLDVSGLYSLALRGDYLACSTAYLGVIILNLTNDERSYNRPQAGENIIVALNWNSSELYGLDLGGNIMFCDSSINRKNLVNATFPNDIDTRVDSIQVLGKAMIYSCCQEDLNGAKKWQIKVINLENLKTLATHQIAFNALQRQISEEFQGFYLSSLNFKIMLDGTRVVYQNPVNQRGLVVLELNRSRIRPAKLKKNVFRSFIKCYIQSDLRVLAGLVVLVAWMIWRQSLAGSSAHTRDSPL